MKGKNLLITLALTILVFVPLSSQCDPPKSPRYLLAPNHALAMKLRIIL
jgi:hypothetical protein